MVKYLRRHPVDRLTVGGGIAKLAKLGQGAHDLHSARSQVDFDRLAYAVACTRLRSANTMLEAYEICGQPLADHVARTAERELKRMMEDAPIVIDVVVCDRTGLILARA